MAVATAEPKLALRRSEAATALGVHPNTVLSWARRGVLETVEMPGGEQRYKPESVEALREQIYGG
jgi:predicted site-specific integrase-resolvase